MQRVLVAMVCVLLFAATALGQDVTKPTWSASVLGNDDLISLRLGYQPFDRTTVGAYGLWRDDVAADDDTVQAWGVGVWAAYSVLENVPFTIWTFEVPVTQYVGVLVGPIWPEGEEPQATAGLLAGISFGDEKARLGVEYQFTLDKSLWSKLADVEQASQVLVAATVRWK